MGSVGAERAARRGPRRGKPDSGRGARPGNRGPGEEEPGPGRGRRARGRPAGPGTWLRPARRRSERPRRSGPLPGGASRRVCPLAPGSGPRIAPVTLVPAEAAAPCSPLSGLRVLPPCALSLGSLRCRVRSNPFSSYGDRVGPDVRPRGAQKNAGERTLGSAWLESSSRSPEATGRWWEPP